MILGTIETTHIIPVDLNCLLYFTEKLLAKQYARKGDNKKAADYTKWAAERQKAILQYCFDKQQGFFTDYNYVKMQSTGRITAAGLFPLCFLDGNLLAEKMPAIAKVVEKQLLADGGLLTTPVKSGQQWDAPNGWAPLQWMGIWGLERCGQPIIAKTIATRWIKLNSDVFARTGKLMEKYNVVNTTLDAGGGEYPGQDGFGWTNGVLLGLMEKYGEEIKNKK
jgi:alpha,alpha-trehalase